MAVGAGAEADDAEADDADSAVQQPPAGFASFGERELLELSEPRHLARRR